MKKIILLLPLMISACATDPANMPSSYVSPLQYQDYSCKQLGAEAQRVSRKASELYGVLDKEASNDAAQMGVGLILLWPTLFFLEGGDGAQAAEYQRLKGEYEAIEQASIQKNCGLEFKTFTPPKPVQKEPEKNKSNFNK